MKTITTKLTVLFFISILLISCEKGDLPLLEQKKFQVAYNKWKESGITNYTFKSTRKCFCPDPGTYEITVTNKVIVAVKNAQGQDFPFTGKGFRTIDELFQFIEASLKRNPDKSSVTYDSTYNHPIEIYFDFIEDAIDDEVGYTIQDFDK